MFVGDINRIDLGTSSFNELITHGSLYVDKSLFIEHFFKETSKVQIVARQRRLGKSLNMNMLYCFLTDAEDYRPLFENLAVRQTPVWDIAHSAPVFLLSFKDLQASLFKSNILHLLNKSLYHYVKDERCPC